MILVTAATGRPGHAVVREFARNKLPMRALYRTREKAKMLEGFSDIETVQGDMMMPHTLGPALEGVDVALMISAAGPELLETQCTFIDACKRSGVRHIVKFCGEDSCVGFDNSKFRSTRSHDQIERYLWASGVPWTILRPAQFMEVYLEEVPSVVKEGSIFLPLGNTTMAPVAISDIAKIAFAILRDYRSHEAKIYKMTGPEALTIEQMCECISQATGKSISYVDCTPEDRMKRWRDLGYPPARVEAFAQLWAERKRCRVSKVYLGTHEWFGVKPTTFAEFARENSAGFLGEADILMTPGVKNLSTEKLAQTT